MSRALPTKIIKEHRVVWSNNVNSHSVAMFYLYCVFNLKEKLMRAALFASVIIMTCVGCGGGGGGSGGSSGGNIASAGGSGGENNSAAADSAPSQTTAASVAGATADGYLVGANVCLDTDADNSCSGEATITTSTEGGAFDISGATEADFAQYPLLTEIVEGVTTDADRITEANPTGVIGTGEGFVLASPPGLLDADGKAFISPITSLVENQRLRAIANGQSPNEALASAKAAILASVGNVDLTADYIAASASGDEAAKAAAERVHILARAVTGLLADAKQELATAIASGDLTAGDTTAVFSVAINQIVKQVSTVVSDVETALASINSRGLSDAERAAALTDRIKQIVTNNDVVDAATLPGLVAVDSVERTALTAREMLLVDGGVWIGEVEGFEFTEIGENGETSTVVFEDIYVGFENLAIIESGETATNTIDVSYDLFPGGDLDPYVDEGVGLTGNGWDDYIDQVTLVTNSDGSVSCDNAVVTCEISNVEVIDLDDQDIASVMENYSQDGALWRKVLQSGFSFTEGSKGYLAEITNGVEYTIFSSPLRFLFGDQESPRPNSISGLINASFDIEAAISTGFSPGYLIDVGRAGFLDGDTSLVSLNLKADGTADYFRIDGFGEGDVGYELLDTITVNYTLETINQVEFVRLPKIDIPSGLQFFVGDNEGDLVFSAFEGQIVYVDVEQGQTAPALLLDTAANEALIEAIDLDKLCCAD